MLLAGAMAAQLVTAIPAASAVVDEPAHLTSGYLSLVQGDLTVNREHPPLVKALAALPLLALGPALPMASSGPGEAAPERASEDFEFDYSRRFLYQSNDADRLLRAARLPIVALALAGGVALFLWARTLTGGAAGGLAALALYAFEPNLLAHGRLVTTDMGAAVFLLVQFACLERALAPAPAATARRWTVAAGIALGCALITRFSSLLAVPLVAGAALLDRRTPGSSRAGRLGAILAIALVVVNAAYGFTGAIFPLAHAPVGGSLKTPVLAWLEADPVMRWLPVPLPRLYLEGLDLARYKNHFVEGPGYLNGEYSTAGWWSYFLLALGMKTTVSLLLLSCAGLALAVGGALKGRDPAGSALAAHVALPASGLLLLVTASTRAQIGLRYVLPVIPFLCVAGGVAAAWLARRPRAAGAVALAVLIGWHAWAGLAIHPYHLAYFNELAGGPDNGWRHLVDSNLDWGQDLVGLSRFMHEKGLSRINLYYFGTADPAYYGIARAVPPEPGWFAVSATHLVGVYLPDHDYLASFRPMRPVTAIGHSILVYHLEQVPPSLAHR